MYPTLFGMTFLQARRETFYFYVMEDPRCQKNISPAFEKLNEME